MFPIPSAPLPFDRRPLTALIQFLFSPEPPAAVKISPGRYNFQTEY